MECKWQITNRHCFRLRHSLFPTIMRAPPVCVLAGIRFTIYLLPRQPPTHKWTQLTSRSVPPSPRSPLSTCAPILPRLTCARIQMFYSGKKYNRTRNLSFWIKRKKKKIIGGFEGIRSSELWYTGLKVKGLKIGSNRRSIIFTNFSYLILTREGISP